MLVPFPVACGGGRLTLSAGSQRGRKGSSTHMGESRSVCWMGRRKKKRVKKGTYSHTRQMKERFRLARMNSMLSTTVAAETHASKVFMRFRIVSLPHAAPWAIRNIEAVEVTDSTHDNLRNAAAVVIKRAFRNNHLAILVEDFDFVDDVVMPLTCSPTSFSREAENKVYRSV